ncbi:hypothetical protein B1J93_04815 [Leptospira kirschneri serovar Pomona]|uniref:Uncharacterized protein n=1 Tax=Leptospira kirschneri serovar Pomona TaxID=561005 RepID=A0A1T1DXG1_9LEPT|nr:hypothetical protein B1J93_04815 [Leptospira kirschneri serovar Pomona]
MGFKVYLEITPTLSPTLFILNGKPLLEFTISFLFSSQFKSVFCFLNNSSPLHRVRRKFLNCS